MPALWYARRNCCRCFLFTRKHPGCYNCRIPSFLAIIYLQLFDGCTCCFLQVCWAIAHGLLDIAHYIPCELTILRTFLCTGLVLTLSLDLYIYFPEAILPAGTIIIRSQWNLWLLSSHFLFAKILKSKKLRDVTFFYYYYV